MKKRILILLALLCIPFGTAKALTNGDKWKNVTCLYVGENGYSAEMQMTGLEGAAGGPPDIAVMKVSKGSSVVYNKGEITNLNKPFIKDAFTLESFVNNNIEKADKANSPSMVCPTYLIYYEYYYGDKTKKNQDIFVSDKESRISAYTTWVNDQSSWWKDVDTKRTSVNVMTYDIGGVYGTDAADKKLDVAIQMEQNQQEINELKDKETLTEEEQSKLEKLENDQTSLNKQAGIYTQATIDQGTQNSETAKEATKKIAKIRKQNNLLNVTVTITSGCAVISNDLNDWLIQLLDIIKIAALILTLLLGMFDFLKGTVSGEADAMKKVWKSFSRRLIAVVLLFLLPVIIEFILGLVSINGVDVDNPLCLKDI